MDLTDTIARVIELKTFASVWYWLSVIVTWSTVSHWLIGVPFDMVMRARRQQGAALDDLETLIGINTRRLIAFLDMGGVWLTALVAFVLSTLTMMGVFYSFELAQGMLCLAAPLTVVGFINFRKARQYHASQPMGAELTKDLIKMRLWIQIIAMSAMFFTAMYGMYYNLDLLMFF